MHLIFTKGVTLHKCFPHNSIILHYSTDVITVNKGCDTLISYAPIIKFIDQYYTMPSIYEIFKL